LYSRLHARKEEIARKVELENLKFDGYYSPSVFYDWLTDIECYLDWYGLSDVAKLLFARRKLVGSVRSYWESVERLHEMQGCPRVLGRNERKAYREVSFRIL